MKKLIALSLLATLFVGCKSTGSSSDVAQADSSATKPEEGVIGTSAPVEVEVSGSSGQTGSGSSEVSASAGYLDLCGNTGVYRVCLTTNRTLVRFTNFSAGGSYTELVLNSHPSAMEPGWTAYDFNVRYTGALVNSSLLVNPSGTQARWIMATSVGWITVPGTSYFALSH